ncbi:hypothetical protein BDZ91DRAFT_787259 [Kalaharituber pfeilii]|nr:hypothetical protein BDZ91DRAFT_787259 [Kalaharituber pfeilii]
MELQQQQEHVNTIIDRAALKATEKELLTFALGGGIIAYDKISYDNVVAIGQTLAEGVFFYGTGRLPNSDNANTTHSQNSQPSTPNQLSSRTTPSHRLRSVRQRIEQRDQCCLITGLRVTSNGTEAAHTISHRALQGTSPFDNAAWKAIKCFLGDKLAERLYAAIQKSPTSVILTLSATLHRLWTYDEIRLYPVDASRNRKSEKEWLDDFDDAEKDRRPLKFFLELNITDHNRFQHELFPSTQILEVDHTGLLDENKKVSTQQPLQNVCFFPVPYHLDPYEEYVTTIHPAALLVHTKLQILYHKLRANGRPQSLYDSTTSPSPITPYIAMNPLDLEYINRKLEKPRLYQSETVVDERSFPVGNS